MEGARRRGDGAARRERARRGGRDFLGARGARGRDDARPRTRVSARSGSGTVSIEISSSVDENVSSSTAVTGPEEFAGARARPEWARAREASQLTARTYRGRAGVRDRSSPSSAFGRQARERWIRRGGVGPPRAGTDPSGRRDQLRRNRRPSRVRHIPHTFLAMGDVPETPGSHATPARRTSYFRRKWRRAAGLGEKAGKEHGRDQLYRWD